MYSINDEIMKVKTDIEEVTRRIESLDVNDPNNRFKIPSAKSELRILEAKLEGLQQLKEYQEKNSLVKKKTFPGNNKK